MKTCKLMNRKKFQFRKVSVGGALLLSSLLAMPIAAQDKPIFHFSIAEQSLDAALKEFGLVADRQVLFPTKLVAGLTVNPVNGKYTAEEALQQMLKGSGLVFEGNGSGVLLLKPEERASREVEKRPASEIEEMIVTATKRETSLQDTALSITALGGETIEKRGLTEMGDYLSTLPGVTMQDRGILGNSITIRGIAVNPGGEREAVGVYFGETPVSGVGAFIWNGVGSVDFKMVDLERVEVLRGPQGTLFGAGSMGGTLRVLPANPDLNETTGEVSAQYSSTGGYGGGNNVVQGVFNLPLIQDQLALRGVAYRYDESGFIKNISGSYTGTYPATPTPNTRDTFGETIAAWGGIARDRDDRGATQTTGFRLSALWQPVDKLSINLSQAWQKTIAEGFLEEQSYYGQYVQLRVEPKPDHPYITDGPQLVPNVPRFGADEGGYYKISLTNLTLDYNLGWGNLHSVSSWLQQDSFTENDYSAGAIGTTGMYFRSAEGSNDNFIQEFRFASEFDGPFQLLAGVYYEDLYREGADAQVVPVGLDQWPLARDLIGTNWGFVPGIPEGFPDDFVWDEFYHTHAPRTDSIKQTAFFGEASWDISEQFTATVGMRAYKYQNDFLHLSQGFWDSSVTPGIWEEASGEDKGILYKANLSWTPNEDTLVYFQWAEGFRPGQALARLNPALFDPEGTGFYTLGDGSKTPIRSVSDPDTLDNYEFGFKGSFADNRITLNAALYHIDWQGLPVSVGVKYVNADLWGSTVINAGKSTSEGAELESELYLLDNLRLNLSASYNESKLAEDGPLGSKGDDLPGSADVNFSAGLEYGFVISGYDTFARIDYAYVGEYNATISQPDTVPASGGYGQINLKGGINLGSANVDLFINNLTDADDFSWVSGTNMFNVIGYRLRPRTVGMNIKYNF